MTKSLHAPRSLGWIAALMIGLALVTVLAFRVNALRSQVHKTDAAIIALQQETLYLETEFEARASQHQLKAWNDVEFGFVAPGAAQYLDSERQLAAFAKPAEPGAPAPVRVASADDDAAAAMAFPAMVSPLTGRPVEPVRASAEPADDAAPPRVGSALADRIGTVRHRANDTELAVKPKRPVHIAVAKTTAEPEPSARGQHSARTLLANTTTHARAERTDAPAKTAHKDRGPAR